MSEALDTADRVHRLADENPLLAHLERCREFLEPALEGGHFTWPDVQACVAHGRAMLWPGKASAMVTEDVTYPSGAKAVQVWLGGGDLEELLAMAPGVEAAARLRGCTSALIEGRRGWEKPLKAAGFALWSVTLKKDL